MRLHPTPKIVMGRGLLERAGEEIAALGHRRVFLVTTLGMPGRPAEAALRASLANAGIGVTVFAGTPAEPGETELDTAVDLARPSNGGSYDAVVGLGGGSALDLAKLVAVRLVDARPIGELYGIANVGRRGLPTVMIPTTSGSGSEVSQDAVLTDRRAGTKRGVKDPHLVPDLALVDPAATDTCPPAVTAASGLDTLCHALEAFTGRRANPICDLYAERSIQLVWRHLVTAVTEGTETSRDGMAEASLLAGLAFSPVGTAAVHAVGYPLSGMWGLSHGAANGLMLPAVMAFNRSAVAAKYTRLEEIFETDDLPAALVRLNERTGIPTRLRDAGIPRDSIPKMAALAAGDRRHLDANPRPMDVQDLESVFESAW